MADLKIRGYAHRIKRKKLEDVMTALAAVADATEEKDVGHGTIQSDAIKEIYFSATGRVGSLDRHIVEAMMDIRDARHNGHFVCSTLFGSDYKEKLHSGQGIRITDPEVQAIIEAAEPEISVIYHNPCDLQDRTTHAYNANQTRKAGDYDHDLHVTLAESGDHNPQYLPTRLGENWRRRCLRGGLGANEGVSGPK